MVIDSTILPLIMELPINKTSIHQNLTGTSANRLKSEKWTGHEKFKDLREGV